MKNTKLLRKQLSIIEESIKILDISQDKIDDILNYIRKKTKHDVREIYEFDKFILIDEFEFIGYNNYKNPLYYYSGNDFNADIKNVFCNYHNCDENFEHINVTTNSKRRITIDMDTSITNFGDIIDVCINVADGVITAQKNNTNVEVIFPNLNTNENCLENGLVDIHHTSLLYDDESL